MPFKKMPADNLSVGFHSPGWPPEKNHNGIITYVSSMQDGLCSLGHDAHVFSTAIGETDLSNSSKVKISETSTSLFEKLILRVLKRHKLDHVIPSKIAQSINKYKEELHLDIFEIEESFGLAYTIQKQVDIPVVVRLHGPWFLNGDVLGIHKDSSFLHRVRREGEAIANAFAITAPSKDVLDKTCHFYDLPSEKAVVIPCPIASVSRLDRWNLNSCDRNLIVFIGRFDRHKGGDLIIDAFAQILKEKPDMKLCFAGPDRDYIDENGRNWQVKEYMHDRIPHCLETGQILYLGSQPTQSLKKLRLNAYLTVVASRYDNFPYTALEALSQGCPIVASNAGGIPEIIMDEVNGLLFKSGDSVDLSTKILRLLNHPQMADRLGKQAREDSLRKFGLKSVAQQTLDFYLETLERWTHK
jgi:glycosyltransferase involved in cell wall biosynthesis